MIFIKDELVVKFIEMRFRMSKWIDEVLIIV